MFKENKKEQISSLRKQLFEDFSLGHYEEVARKADYLHVLLSSESYPSLIDPRFKDIPKNGLNSTDFCFSPIGDYYKAERFYRNSLEIIAKKRGKKDFEYIRCLYTLASIKVVTGRLEDALALFEKAVEAEDNMIEHILSHGSEKVQTDLVKIVKEHLDIFLSFIFQYYSDSTTTVRKAMDITLRRKFIVADSTRIRHEQLLNNNTKTRHKIIDFFSIRKQINSKKLAGPDSDEFSTTKKYYDELKKLEQKKESLEQQLQKETKKIPFRLELNYSRKITDSLSESEVVVEFINLSLFNFKALSDNKEELWMSPHYIAFVLSEKNPNHVYLLDCGDACVIDQLIHFYKSFVTKANGFENLLKSREKDSGNLPFGRTLRHAIFDPLLNIIGDSKRIYISTDGDLTKISFEILPIDNSSYVIDKYSITYLSTSRDILLLKYPSQKHFSDPVIVADPDFDLGNTDSALSIEETTITPGNYYLSSPYFQRLPGARTEAIDIGKILGVKPCFGKDALESILHLVDRLVFYI